MCVLAVVILRSHTTIRSQSIKNFSGSENVCIPDRNVCIRYVFKFLVAITVTFLNSEQIAVIRFYTVILLNFSARSKVF